MGKWRTSGDGWECRPDGHWIETERLIVRPLSKADFESMIAVLDDEVVSWQGYPSDPVELREYVRSWFANLDEPPPGRLMEQWAVCDRSSGEVVGNRLLVAYGNRMRGHACETGGSFKAGWREKGYGTEELSALLRLVQEHLGYGIVFAGTSPDNARALRLYQRCGFVLHGRQPGRVLPNGTTIDAVVLRRDHGANRTCKKALRPRFF